MKEFAVVTFPVGDNARKKFLYLNQIKKQFGNPMFGPATGYVVFSKADDKTHRAEIRVAPHLQDYELAPIKDLLNAAVMLGANIEFR